MTRLWLGLHCVTVPGELGASRKPPPGAPAPPVRICSTDPADPVRSYRVVMAAPRFRLLAPTTQLAK